MENSVTDTEVQQSFRSPPRRRRSTFFERRDSVVPTLSENVDSEGIQKDLEAIKQRQEMTRYYEKLLSEKEQWKREVNERRNKYHDLRQQYRMAANTQSRSRMSYSVLSNDDIEFLKAKPNLSKLVDTQQKFHSSVKETIALVRRANELDKVLLDFCDEKVSAITDYILQNSAVE